LIDTSAQLQITAPSKFRLISSFQEALLQDSWNEFSLTLTLLNIALKQDTHKEDLFAAVLKFYTLNNRAIELLETAITQEFDVSFKSPSTIFRSDGVATRLIAKYFELESIDYINQCLKNTIASISSLNFELEGEKKT